MRRFFVLILTVSILLAAGSLDLYAHRRPPTESEQIKFLPIVRDWLSINWEKKQKLDWGSYRRQRITEVTYCCIDEIDNGKHIHIVDIKFHEQIYEHEVLVDESDMTQRVLFKCKDFRIIDREPMPAYKLEGVA